MPPEKAKALRPEGCGIRQWVTDSAPWPGTQRLQFEGGPALSLADSQFAATESPTKVDQKYIDPFIRRSRKQRDVPYLRPQIDSDRPGRHLPDRNCRQHRKNSAFVQITSPQAFETRRCRLLKSRPTVNLGSTLAGIWFAMLTPRARIRITPFRMPGFIAIGSSGVSTTQTVRRIFCVNSFPGICRRRGPVEKYADELIATCYPGHRTPVGHDSIGLHLTYETRSTLSQVDAR